jgi:hypothetical protein
VGLRRSRQLAAWNVNGFDRVHFGPGAPLATTLSLYRMLPVAALGLVNLPLTVTVSVVVTVTFDFGCLTLTAFAPVIEKLPDLETVIVPTLTANAVWPGLARHPSVLNWKFFSAEPLLDTTKLIGSAGDSLVVPENLALWVGLAAKPMADTPNSALSRMNAPPAPRRTAA